MARRRRRDDILDRMIARFSLRGTLLHPATLFLVATVLIIGTAIFSWERYKNRILPPAHYQLTSDNLQITPQPSWTSPDLRSMIVGDQRQQDYQPRSIMDTDLVPDLANALNSVGWIENIDKIQKSRHGLDVQLTFRQPVGMVEINSMTMPKSSVKDLKPVNLHIDRQGVLMDGPLSEQPGDHLLISIGNPQYMDQLLPWSRWQDALSGTLEAAWLLSFNNVSLSSQRNRPAHSLSTVDRAGPEIPRAFDLGQPSRRRNGKRSFCSPKNTGDRTVCAGQWPFPSDDRPGRRCA